MKIKVKRKTHRKAGALTVSRSKTCNYIIKHQVIFVKYSIKPRASPEIMYEYIKSLSLEDMAKFIVDFRRVFGRVHTIELAKKILESEAVV